MIFLRYLNPTSTMWIRSCGLHTGGSERSRKHIFNLFEFRRGQDVATSTDSSTHHASLAELAEDEVRGPTHSEGPDESDTESCGQERPNRKLRLVWNHQDEISKSVGNHDHQLARVRPQLIEENAEESENDKEGVPYDERCAEDQSEGGEIADGGEEADDPRSLSCHSVDVWREDLPTWTWLIRSTFSRSEHWSLNRSQVHEGHLEGRSVWKRSGGDKLKGMRTMLVGDGSCSCCCPGCC